MTRRRQAAFPTGKSFATWREEDSSIPPAIQRALRTLEWIGRAETLSISGPSGTGKSHFVEAIGHAAIDAGLKVSWFTLETLTQTITRSKVDASTTKVVQRICRSDLIVVDNRNAAGGPSRDRSSRSDRRCGLRAAQPRGHI